MGRAPFWSDDFDMDLMKVLPDLPEILGDTAGTILYVHGGTSFGRLNHPSVWAHGDGHVAFFGLSNPPPKDAYYYTHDPVVECTLEEALRDAWPHGYRMLCEGEEVFDSCPTQNSFMVWMHDLRGWQKAAAGEVDTIKRRLREQLHAARLTVEILLSLRSAL